MLYPRKARQHGRTARSRKSLKTTMQGLPSRTTWAGLVSSEFTARSLQRRPLTTAQAFRARGLCARRRTHIRLWAHLTYLTNNLVNLPASVKVTGGSVTAYTTYGYDETSRASSGVTTQLDSSPPDGNARGNQTSTHRQLINGSAIATTYCPAVSSGGYLVSNITYYDTGMVSVSKDACSLPTTFLYSLTYVGAFPTTITNPKNQSTTHTFDFNTGLLASTTDPNSQTTSLYLITTCGDLASAIYPDGGSAVVTRQETSFPKHSHANEKNHRVTESRRDQRLRRCRPRLAEPTHRPPRNDLHQLQRTTAMGAKLRSATDIEVQATQPMESPPMSTTGRSYLRTGSPDGTAVAGSVCPASQTSNDVFTTYVEPDHGDGPAGDNSQEPNGRARKTHKRLGSSVRREFPNDIHV